MEKSNIELNERQKEILRETGLSENVEDLTENQKKSIARIDEMLSYLEQKYDRSFHYLGYSDGTEDEEWLTAYEENGLEEDVVTVTVTENGGFRDDFPWLYVKDVYEESVKAYVQQLIDNENVKVYVSYGETSLESIENITDQTIEENCMAVGYVYIYGSYTENEIREMAETFSLWYQEKGWEGGPEFITVEDESVYFGINQFNHEDVLSNGTYAIRVGCTVFDGEVNIF